MVKGRKGRPLSIWREMVSWRSADEATLPAPVNPGQFDDRICPRLAKELKFPKQAKPRGRKLDFQWDRIREGFSTHSSRSKCGGEHVIRPDWEKMIEEILPPWVATATFKGDDPAGWLWPAEAALVERAVESRVREFTTGRMCARKALAQLGAETGPILSGDQREALWPMGVTGSITHCRGYRAAAVAWRKQVLGIGIDAELDSVLPDGLLDLVASEQERAWMARQPGPEPWDRLLFSAKESVYKALYPLTRRWLDFADVQVTFLPEEYSFAATVRPEMSACAQEAGLLRGRYLRRDGLILTALLVPLDCSAWVRRVQSSADPV